MQRRGYACKYNFALVHFFPFCQIMFPKIGSSTVKTLFLHIQNLCIFLMNWLCFHYVMSHFIPGNVLCSEVNNVNIASSSFLLFRAAWYIFFYRFIFSLFVLFHLKQTSCSKCQLGLAFYVSEI